MVNSTSVPCVDYSEERCPGEHLQPGLFYDDDTKFCLASGSDVLSFASENGQRLGICRHSDNVVGIHFHRRMLISITDAPEIYIWGENSEKLRLRRKVEIPRGYRIEWSYELGAGEIYFLATNCEESRERAEDSMLLKVALNDSADELSQRPSVVRPPIASRCVALTGKRPQSKRHMAIGKDFYVKCQGKWLIVSKFERSDGTECQKEDEIANRQKKFSDQFVLDSHFQVDDQSLVEFDSVRVLGDSLFATLNIGRIYCWSNFRTCGLSLPNCSHVTLTGHRVVTEYSAHGTMFVGTGTGLLLKYNIGAASGAGRWHKLEQLSLECPVRSMVLSDDNAVLVLIHSDNGVSIVRSSDLFLTGKAEGVKKPTIGSIGILHDPLNSQSVFTNSKVGTLQWIDPLRWKTTDEVEVSGENVPPEDTFNRPDFLWLDVYSICLSVPRIVTCEHRRNDSQKTYLKFWRRSSADVCQLQMENCVVLPRRVSFIRSTLDRFWHCSAVTVPMANEQQFLVIFTNGQMEVYVRSENRGSLWHCDLKRNCQNWQQFEVKHCSTIEGTHLNFATVSSTADNSRIFLWDLATLSLVKSIDSLVGPEQVEWSAPSVLLVACRFGIVSFDSAADVFLWAIHRPNLSIFSNHLATFAHDGRFVYVLNASNGTLANGPLPFSERQKNVIAVGSEKNVWFIGITEGGALSALKPDLPQNKFEVSAFSAEGPKQKRTAFSHLMALNGRTPKNDECQTEGKERHTNRSVFLLETPSIKQFVDGPAHSLPPIAQLARQFVLACLAKKKKSSH